MNNPIILITTAIFGLCFGSFLNVLIYRLPRKQSLLWPSSKCPNCNTKIKFYDNIPLFSYILLGGKCRSCKTSISLRYPLVELLSASLAVLAIFYFGLSLKGFITIFLSLIFIAVFFIDLDFTIIPDIFTLPGIVIGLGLSFFPNNFVNWSESLIGIAVGGGLFLIVGLAGEFIFKKEAMGFGDVKFAAMLGAFLGWQNLLLILIMASFLGTIVGVILIYLSRNKERSSYIPFGPFLVIAALLSVYLGDNIINTYLNFIGL